MRTIRRLDLADLVALVLIVAASAGVRIWYVSTTKDDRPIRVQDTRKDAKESERLSGSGGRGSSAPTELDILVDNLVRDNQFACRPPFGTVSEETAHVAPGYPYFLSFLDRLSGRKTRVEDIIGWIQAGLGALAAGFYYVVALMAFRSRFVAILTALFCGVHPFWIVNAATVDEGTLATFLLASSLFLGTRAGIAGGALTSLLYGLSLAALALVRAALLPFAFVGLLWFLIRCRAVPRGWSCAILAVLGFVNGLAPWTIRNWQTFQEPVPVVTSTYLHLWMGNNPQATGGPMSEEQMREALGRSSDDPSTTSWRIARAVKQTDRYGLLAVETLENCKNDPAGTVRRRLGAALFFLFGESFIRHPEDWVAIGVMTPPGRFEPLAAWLGETLPVIFYGFTLGMLLLGLLGWRWTYAWRRESRLLALAAIFVPLPYILSHAEWLVGPRLPLDGVLLTFAAYALACLVPGVGTSLFAGPEGQEEEAASRRMQEEEPRVSS